jgi:hypothetical protein
VVSFAEQLWAIPPSGINCLLSNPDAGRKDRRAMPATTIDPGPAARFAAGFVALFAAHNLADYWSQTYSQATNKARRGDPHENRAGRSAALAHIATYTAISTSAVSAANRVLGLGASPRGIVAGQLISVASHYFSDRRHPLRELAARTGRLQFHDSGVHPATGGALLDQSWHISWLTVATLATATVGGVPAPRGRPTAGARAAGRAGTWGSKPVRATRVAGKQGWPTGRSDGGARGCALGGRRR